MQSDQFLAIRRERATGEIRFRGPLNGRELERMGELTEATCEIFAVPLSDVLALAGDHEDSGPMRMIAPMTVDQVALRIMAALFVNQNPMTEAECVEQAWNTAELFMAEAMKRDAMGVPLQSDEPDEGETEDGESEKDGQEKGQGCGGSGAGTMRAADDRAKGGREMEA